MGVGRAANQGFSYISAPAEYDRNDPAHKNTSKLIGDREVTRIVL